MSALLRRRALRRKKILLLCSLIAYECANSSEDDEPRPARREWVKKVHLRRKSKGYYRNLFLELRFEDPMRFRRCLRMDTHTFDMLVDAIRPLIEKQDTQLRESIPAGERLSLTLRHLATGESQQVLSDGFRIAQSTISGIIEEVSAALVAILKEKYLHFPNCEAEWREISEEFSQRWNFPNCVGAMDGKHFLIIPSYQSGSYYYNYKGTFSVVLLAMVDAHLRFIYADVGTNGRVSDSGVWNKCSLKLKIDSGELILPPPSNLPNSDVQCPYVIVGDEGFPLTENVMIPYPGAQCSGRKDRRIFNGTDCQGHEGVQKMRLAFSVPDLKYSVRQ